MNTKWVLTRFTYLSIAIILLLTLFLAPVSQLSTPPAGAASYLVQGTDSGWVTFLVESAGGTVSSHLPLISGLGAWLTPEQLAVIAQDSGITAITPNNQVMAAGKKDDNGQQTETENKKGSQQPIPETNYPDVVGADVVWEADVTGQGVSVAIVDTGLESTPGLQEGIDGSKGRIVGWVDFVQGKKKPQDKNGHGTHIAGIIANTQVGEDGEWNGISPGVNLVGVRVLNKDGYGTYENVIQGIQWVVENKDVYNIRVLNLSLVSAVHSPYWADPLNQAVMQAWANGIVVVVAAGNGGPDPMTISVPGNVPYVITVGAFTDNYTPMDWSDDYIAPFSAAGPTLDGFVKPDLVAPGGHIVSIMDEEDALVKLYPETYVAKHYYSIAGTSQAAAVVSGITALVLEQNPNLTPDQVKNRIMYGSAVWVDPVSTDAVYSMWQQGAGRVDAPTSVFGDFEDTFANAGMDIWADLAGTTHYEGYSYYDPETESFRLRGDYNSWGGGYGSWLGGYGSWLGGYGSWAGSYGSWAGGYGSWLGGYGSWVGSYGSWLGSYGSWLGGYGSWLGGYGSWLGGYGSWAGGYGSWLGTEPWIGSIYSTDNFVSDYLAGKSPNISTTTAAIEIQQ